MTGPTTLPNIENPESLETENGPKLGQSNSGEGSNLPPPPPDSAPEFNQRDWGARFTGNEVYKLFGLDPKTTTVGEIIELCFDRPLLEPELYVTLALIFAGKQFGPEASQYSERKDALATLMRFRVPAAALLAYAFTYSPEAPIRSTALTIMSIDRLRLGVDRAIDLLYDDDDIEVRKAALDLLLVSDRERGIEAIEHIIHDESEDTSVREFAASRQKDHTAAFNDKSKVALIEPSGMETDEVRSEFRMNLRNARILAINLFESPAPHNPIIIDKLHMIFEEPEKSVFLRVAEFLGKNNQ